MTEQLEHLQRCVPDLTKLDPLSTEVRDWLDRAYAALKKVDVVEGAILKLHQRSLSDPTRKAGASAQIVETIDRARATSEFMQRKGLLRRVS